MCAHLLVEVAGAGGGHVGEDAARLVQDAFRWRVVRRAQRHQAVDALGAEAQQVDPRQPAARRVRQQRHRPAARLPAHLLHRGRDVLQVPTQPQCLRGSPPGLEPSEPCSVLEAYALLSLRGMHYLKP